MAGRVPAAAGEVKPAPGHVCYRPPKGGAWPRVPPGAGTPADDRQRTRRSDRATAKRHPTLAAVAVTIGVAYALALVWGGGYGVGRDLARAQNTPAAASAD